MAGTNRSTFDLDRPRIEALIENLVALLDTIDGDPEDYDDELDEDDDREEDDPDEDDDADEDNGDDEPDLYAVPIYPTMPEHSQDPDDWPGKWFGRQANAAMYR